MRKVLRTNETAFRYARQAPVVYPKLGPFHEQLTALLTARLSQSRRERLTLMRMWELLREGGYAGSYDAVRRYAQHWRRTQGHDHSRRGPQPRTRAFGGGGGGANLGLGPRLIPSVSGGDPPALPGRHPEFDNSGNE